MAEPSRKSLMVVLVLAVGVAWGTLLLRPGSRSVLGTVLRGGKTVVRVAHPPPGEVRTANEIAAARHELDKVRDDVRRLSPAERQRLARPLWSALVARSAADVILDDLSYASPERQEELKVQLRRAMATLKETREALARELKSSGRS